MARTHGPNISTFKSLRTKDTFTVVFHSAPRSPTLTKTFRVTAQREDGHIRFKELATGEIHTMDQTKPLPAIWKAVRVLACLNEAREVMLPEDATETTESVVSE